MFSVLIASWNNLDYLKLCIESVRKNSSQAHEILVHVNDGSDGTLEWVRAQNIQYSRSRANIGVCLAFNELAARAKGDWLILLNDDMVCCPGWDSAYAAAIAAAPSDLAVFSSTMIEPRDTRNPLVIVGDYGRTPQTFDEAGMLAGYLSVKRQDIVGQASQPTVIARKWWLLVGGYSIEFGPGMSSDNDLWMKLWVVGCRHYRVLAASRIYHFSQVSTGRVRRNRGGRTFVMKWGITQKEFDDLLLQTARTVAPETLSLPRSTTKGRMKRIGYAIADYPLGDLAAWDPTPGRHIGSDD
jgi:glycosyltransferase involved in cell wall biosynthesis